MLVETGADAEVERLFGLLLLGALLEARSFSTETKLNHFAHLWHVFATLRNDALHVAAFCTDEAPCHLELTFIWDLDVVAARILDLAICIAHVGSST